MVQYLQDNGRISPDKAELAFTKNLQTKLGNFQLTQSLTDGGITTRANIPFLDQPEAPKFGYRDDLPDMIKKDICFIQKHLITHSDQSEAAKSKLKRMILPYMAVMSNLPGGVHNCGEATVCHMVSKLQFDPEKSILLECGSGAPVFGLQASLFTKETICLDLPEVMNTVYSIIAAMSHEETLLMNTIHLVSGSINFFRT